MDDFESLSHDEMHRLIDLMYEYFNIVAFLDMADENPNYFENMASIRSRCDEIAAAVSKPFADLRQYVTAEVGRVMTERGQDKAKTDSGTFYFTSPSKAVYIKDVEGFLDKLELHPEVHDLLRDNITLSAKTGSLAFRGKR